ncbi:MAG: LamG-like jellyroll fold domain-containing protein [Rubripirellula sp.]
MKNEIRNLIFRTIDGSVTDAEFELLQDEIERSVEVREEYLRAVYLCESLREVATGEYASEGLKARDLAEASMGHAAAAGRDGARSSHDSEMHAGDVDSNLFVTRSTDAGKRSRIGMFAAIAVLLLGLIGGAAFLAGRQFGRPSQPQIAENDGAADRVLEESGEEDERTIAGHASLRRTLDLKWSVGEKPYREGDVLPAGFLNIAEGVAEIDFFCGATLIVEGPATLDLESDWSVRLISGRLRANVPPAARGFVVRAAESEIVDLGTEFAVDVGLEHAQVEVIDGEIKLVGGQHDGSHLLTGERRTLTGSEAEEPDFANLSTIGQLQRRRSTAMSNRFEEWKEYSSVLRDDDRLIAYYPIAEGQRQRRVSNAAASGASRDGSLVGLVGSVAGRFGRQSSGLEFDRAGSRVRVRIDGEFNAYTFACWVRIDSLDRRYNSLFMGDGYENGEPHWQIRDDGKLMFSVMVDDTKEVMNFNEFDEGSVKGAGLHKVYYSEPIWDVSKSGQWIHLAAVYDPANRSITQYANGKQVGQEEIKDKFFIDQLRIGPAEIGNWGQPFRETPWFAVRNLNGVIDEMAIFGSALDAEEIESMFQQGKPIGY